MSEPRQNHPNAGKLYSNIVKPLKIDLQFTVAAADAGGLGVTSVKSNGYVKNVFMHTSQTPGANNNQTNPNPAAGLALIYLKNNFNAFLGAQSIITSPGQTATKIDNAALTPGLAYVISTLGNASLATWQGVGLPVGVTPAVGVPFIATAAGGSGNTSTSRVMLPNPSGIFSVEVFGQPALTSNSNIYGLGYSGQYVIAQFLAPTISTGAYVSPMIATAPVAASVVNMALWFDQSSVTVDGL